MPIDDEFWQLVGKGLVEDLGSILEEAATDGIVEAALALGFTDRINWALANEQVISWVGQHTANVVAQITQTNMGAFVEAFEPWHRSGAHLNDLITELTPAYGPQRADWIATTETTRAFAQGNAAAWRSSNAVEGMEWMTAQDELVCPICVELDGTKVAWDEQFGTDEAPISVDTPPAHVGCRCWLRPVTRMPEDSMEEGIPEGPGPEMLPGQLFDLSHFPMSTTELGYEADKLARNFIIRGDDVTSGVVRREAKETIMYELQARTGLSADDIRDAIHQWAMTSNDNDWASLEFQRIVHEMFGVDLSDWQKEQIAYMMREYEKIPGADNLWVDRYGIMKSTVSGHGYATGDEAMRAFIQEMYNFTQKELTDANLSSVTLYRGVKFSSQEAYNAVASVPKGSPVSIIGNAMESWSTSPDIAEGFASLGHYGGVVFKSTFSKERILGTARTGFGCLSEHEWVVIGNIADDVGDVYKLFK